MANNNYGNVVLGIVTVIGAVAILSALGVMLNTDIAETQWEDRSGTIYNETINSLNNASVGDYNETSVYGFRSCVMTLISVTLSNGSNEALPLTNFSTSNCSVTGNSNFEMVGDNFNFTYFYTYKSDTTQSLEINNSIGEITGITDYYGLWILAGGIVFAVILFSVVFLVISGINGGNMGGGDRSKLPKLRDAFKRNKGGGSSGDSGSYGA